MKRISAGKNGKDGYLYEACMWLAVIREDLLAGLELLTGTDTQFDYYAWEEGLPRCRTGTGCRKYYEDYIKEIRPALTEGRAPARPVQASAGYIRGWIDGCYARILKAAGAAGTFPPAFTEPERAVRRTYAVPSYDLLLLRETERAADILFTVMDEGVADYNFPPSETGSPMERYGFMTDEEEARDTVEGLRAYAATARDPYRYDDFYWLVKKAVFLLTEAANRFAGLPDRDEARLRLTEALEAYENAWYERVRAALEAAAGKKDADPEKICRKLSRLEARFR